MLKNKLNYLFLFFLYYLNNDKILIKYKNIFIQYYNFIFYLNYFIIPKFFFLNKNNKIKYNKMTRVINKKYIK